MKYALAAGAKGLTAMVRWSVDIIRHRAEHLGEVDAPKEQEGGRGKISDTSTFHVQQARL
jgi:hypothetical protein